VIDRSHSTLEMPITTTFGGQKLPMPSMQVVHSDSYCSSSSSNSLNRDPPVKPIHKDS
jgi:hypothetical protein